MPELPDVEIARRALFKRGVLGKKIAAFEVVRAPGTLVRTLQGISEEEFRRAVIGASFEEFTRKGKFLIATLSTGEVIVFHFMLSGWLEYFPSGVEISDKARKHAKLEFTFDDGSALLFTDPRNMGRVFLIEKGEYERAGVLARMGVEPLSEEFTLERLKSIIDAGAGRTVKDLITDQEKIAGIGNIYSDEILRRAGIRPDRRAATLTPEEVGRLHRAIPAVLREGIAEMEAGREVHSLAWRKKGALCPGCGGEVVAVKKGATHYYWCPRCQK